MENDFLLIAGDVFFDSEIKIDTKILDQFASATASIVNLEGSVNFDNSTSNKCAPTLTLNEQWYKYLQILNITHFNTLNNHSFDHGITSHQRLNKQIVENGCSVLRQSEIFIIGGLRVGVCTTLEFNEHYEATELNFCDSHLFFDSIKTMRSKCDYLVIQCHGGLEKVNEPIGFFKDLYRNYIDLGADLVVGHHPHIVQDIEVYNNKKIYYSIGDFIFNSSSINRFNDYGLIIKINFVDGVLKDEAISISQKSNYVEIADSSSLNFRSDLTEADAVKDLINLIQISNRKVSFNNKLLSLKIIVRYILTPKKLLSYSHLVRKHLQTNDTYKYLIRKYKLDVN